MKVQKFGGTSVGSPEKILAVAKQIERQAQEGSPLVVVVSAMGHTTDELIALAEKVSRRPPSREMDMLLSVGERITMSLLSMALDDLGVPAVSLTGSQSGILTDTGHSNARIKRISGDRIRQGLSEGKVVIVAGFQGVSERKEITTLGRGGSDTTAVALAIELKAPTCEIYTDVDGVYSADPNQVKDARVFSEISHDFMVALALRGAQVLHPRSVKLAKKFGVDIWVKNSDLASPGTLITAKKGAHLESTSILAVTGDENKLLLKLVLNRPTVFGTLWDEAAKNRRAIYDCFFQDTTLWCFVERAQLDGWKASLQKLSADGFLKDYVFLEDQVPLSIVGECFDEGISTLNQALDVMNGERIPVQLAVANERSITLSIPRTRLMDGVSQLHKKLVSST